MQGLVAAGVPALTFDPVKQRYIDVNGREYLPDELEQDDDELEFGEFCSSAVIIVELTDPRLVLSGFLRRDIDCHLDCE